MHKEKDDFRVCIEGNRVVLIAAADDRMGLGRDRIIPWDVPADRAFFRRQTGGAAVMMGRITYEGLRDAPGFGWTPCAVLTHQTGGAAQDGVVFGADPETLLAHCRASSQVVYCAGGASVYRAMRPQATDILLSRIGGDWDCDVFFFPIDPSEYRLEKTWAMPGFRLQWYRKIAAAGV